MDYTNKPLDPILLSRFKQLKNLNSVQLELLAGALHLRCADKGTILLQRGDTSAYSLYLVKGKLRLATTDGLVTEIGHDAPQALNPIAQMLPRRYEVTALSPVEYLTIDSQLLEGILTNPEESITATELLLDEVQLVGDSGKAQLTEALLDDLAQDRLMLPSLPDIAIRVGREMNEENTNAHKLARIIQTDPVITAKLVRAANSPLYAGVSAVDSCSAAVIRLGTNTTHNLVLTFALRELFITRFPILRYHMHQLWDHSVKVSALCYVLAKLSGRFDPEHALLAGLLHDIGVVAILNYTKQFPDVLKDESTLDHVIKDLRGIIGARILSAWGFTEDLVIAAEEAEHWFRDGSDPAEYADLVIVAQLHSFIGTPKMRGMPALDDLPAFKKLHMGELTPQMSLRIMEKAQDRISRAEALLKS